MRTESSGRKQSLIEDARRERGGGSAGPPGASRPADGSVFQERDGWVALNLLFSLSQDKNTGFFKAGKIFEVKYYYDELLFPSAGKKLKSAKIHIFREILVNQLFVFKVMLKGK